ncbi:hypothetical protein [Algicella marina]|uniref:Nickel transport protein n=1 Tax=Algicella marina TaxID=2683284 RepID=A0A6P1T4I3_9RHOB|nr:hypothetical protein [Algicella marina]QHQ36406.1 hypothetical protein GO499_15095 [Algicella marina]
MIRSALIVSLMLAATPTLAHRLVIYAYAAGGEVIVEARFSNQKPAQTGSVTVAAEDETVLAEAELDPSGETRIPISDSFAPGVIVTVKTGEGHEDYWVLTPDDIEAGK